MSKFNTEELVSAYLALRNSRAELKDNYEEADGKLKSEMEQIEQAMLEICNDVGADSIKTTLGTVIRKSMSGFTAPTGITLRITCLRTRLWNFLSVVYIRGTSRST